MNTTLRVSGYRELDAAFKAADREMHKELRRREKQIGEPVRRDAEALAVSGIPRVGLPWSQMRVGVTSRLVYVAPKKRGVGRGDPRSRPKFGTLLLSRAMEPALAMNEAQIEREYEALLDDVADRWERF